MSTTPNEPQNPQSGVPGQYGQSGSTQPGQPQPYGQGAVNGAPQGGPNGQPYGQQYGQAGGKYGTAEYNPGQYTGLMERPSTVDRLLKLTLVSLGIYVLSGILGMIAVNSIDFVRVYRDMGMDSATATEMAGKVGGIGGPIGSIVSLIIGIALYLLVWNGLKKGKNWARILGTVFAAIAILGGLFGLIGTFIYPAPWNIIMIALALVKVVVDILWIVTAFKAPTTAWFNQNRVQR
ncbi:hypothetical protein CWC38_04705 [Kocuria tytonicola]|uniref:hypothetical protein n=1 Tax=Kocuria tytonicola TaxID=2055946 RepID=UPI000EF910D1|nr:hypothetical protein [Kocuria tytonicola]RLZ03619.1 hypothetical protein CWC38_04705 [Kocuria tytonicola]